jgi:hypothetical protein
MMSDPPRLRSDAGFEGLLLRSSRSQVPPDAEDEVWRRLQIATTAGATAAGVGASVAPASTASKIAAKTLWGAVLKWGAVAAVGLPVAGAAVHWGTHLGSAPAPSTAQHAVPDPAPRVEPAPLDVPSPAAHVEAPAPEEAPAPLHAHAPSASSRSREATSALRRESLGLGAARAKFATGDARGALDDVTRLSAEFPQGRLVQEREVLAIDCLDAIGDREGARRRARRFLDQFPQSPYVVHVRQLGE